MKKGYSAVIPDELYLHVRDNSIKRIWSFYFRHNGRAYRGSTRKSDYREAMMVALERYRCVKSGQDHGAYTKRDISFTSLCKRWLDHVSTEPNFVYRQRICKKFMEPFFAGVKKVDDVSKLTVRDINDYISWRRSYYTTGPGVRSESKVYERGGKTVRSKSQAFGVPKNSTLNRENQTLRHLLRFAVDEGLLRAADLPNVPTLKSDGSRRQAFTGEHCEKLLANAAVRITDATSEKMKQERTNLFNYITLLRYTGLRPKEAIDLDWTDVDLGSKCLVVKKGKTGRRVVPIMFDELVSHLRRMRDEALKAGRISRSDNAAPLFVNFTGKRIASFKRSFERLLTATNLGRATGQRYSLYSFRHHIATHLAGLGLPEAMIVNVMGTSRRMMDVHYDHTTAANVLKWLEANPPVIRSTRDPVPKREDTVRLSTSPSGAKLVMSDNRLLVKSGIRYVPDSRL